MSRYNSKQPQQEKQSTYPYYVSSSANKSGLFSKIKGFFNNSGREQKSTTNEQSQLQSDLTKEQIRENKRKTYNFDNVNVSTIDLSVHSNLSFTSKNPNDTLSEFFNKKGNQPLNDIEIEGVMSLIKKSQSQNSRVPSRHNSFMFNPNMDSKLHGLSSFNDANNTTILRSASNDLPKPVKIKTPTFVSRSNTSDVYNSSRLNNSMNVTNNSMNTSRSFMNTSGIRKKRIVNYSTLESPYKLKNHSPLTAYLEKKKKLEKESILNTKPIVSTAYKSDRVYKGGIIDLSKMEDDDEREEREEQKVTEGPVKKTLSKTASKVLDILNFEEFAVNKSRKEPDDIQEKKERNDIITIDDDDENDEVKNIKSSILPSKPKSITKPIEPSTFKASTTPKFTFNPKANESKVQESVVPITSAKPTFSFSTTKNESPIEQAPKPSILSTMPTTSFTFPKPPIATDKPVIAAPFKQSIPVPPQPANSDIEKIDSFTFPEVASPVKQYKPISNGNGILNNKKLINENNDNNNNKSRSKPDENNDFEFTFPSVAPLSSTIKVPTDDESKIYDDVFKFWLNSFAYVSLYNLL